VSVVLFLRYPPSLDVPANSKTSVRSRGHSRSLKIAPFDRYRSYATSYQSASAIVTIALSCAIFVLQDIKNIATPGSRGVY